MALINGTEIVSIKREMTASEHGFCTLCGARYEAGEKIAALATAPTPRGRIAHAECVRRYNARVERQRQQVDQIAPPAKSLMDVVGDVKAAEIRVANQMRRRYGVELIGHARNAAWMNLSVDALLRNGAVRVAGGWRCPDGSLLPDPEETKGE
mgnify:CR=1 FL=1